MTKNQMIHRWLSPSTCKELSIQRAVRRTKKSTIKAIYENESLSNNQRRKMFYQCIKGGNNNA